MIDHTATISEPTPSKNKIIIKRYQNRKLYDCSRSCYVTLDDIAKMVRLNEEVLVFDYKSKNDITAATFTQIIFEAERQASLHAPISTLREVIQYGSSNLSGYLAKLGAFSQDYAQPKAQVASNAQSSQVPAAIRTTQDFVEAVFNGPTKPVILPVPDFPNLPISALSSAPNP